MNLKKLGLLATAAFGLSLAIAAHAAPPCQAICDAFDDCVASAQSQEEINACTNAMLSWNWCTGDRQCIRDRMI